MNDLSDIQATETETKTKTKTNTVTNPNTDHDCAICDMPLTDLPIEWLVCAHGFHKACISEMFSHSIFKCPLCRHPIAMPVGSSYRIQPHQNQPNIGAWSAPQYYADGDISYGAQQARPGLFENMAQRWEQVAIWSPCEICGQKEGEKWSCCQCKVQWSDDICSQCLPNQQWTCLKCIGCIRG